MQTVGRRHQFSSGRRAHHNVRVGIEGNYDRLAAMGTGIADKRRDELLVSTVNAVEHANGDRCGTQVLTLIKRIGSNDASLVRLAREKDTRELASGQHHRTPPIACGNTCSMTKRPPSMRASALSPHRAPAQTAPSRHRNRQAHAQRECVGRRAGRRQDHPANRHAWHQGRRWDPRRSRPQTREKASTA